MRVACLLRDLIAPIVNQEPHQFTDKIVKKIFRSAACRSAGTYLRGNALIAMSAYSVILLLLLPLESRVKCTHYYISPQNNMWNEEKVVRWKRLCVRVECGYYHLDSLFVSAAQRTRPKEKNENISFHFSH